MKIRRKFINVHKIYKPNENQAQINQHLKPNEALRALNEKIILSFIDSILWLLAH